MLYYLVSRRWRLACCCQRLCCSTVVLYGVTGLTDANLRLGSDAQRPQAQRDVSSRSFNIRSIPALRVWSEAGQVMHAPNNSTVTSPVSSFTSCKAMSPSSAWMAGRITSITFFTSSFKEFEFSEATSNDIVSFSHALTFLPPHRLEK